MKISTSKNDKTLTILNLIMVLLAIILTSIYVAHKTMNDTPNKIVSSIISEDDALGIVYTKIDNAFNYIYSQNVYCGANLDYNNNIIEKDNNKYIISNNFKSINSINNFLQNTLSKEMLEKYHNDVEDVEEYIEQDNNLYCLVVDPEIPVYNEKKTKVKIRSILSTIIYADANISYDDESEDVSIKIEKKANGNWVITNYEIINS